MGSARTRALLAGLVILNLSVFGAMSQQVSNLEDRVDNIEQENQRYRNELRAATNGSVSPDGMVASSYSSTVPVLLTVTATGDGQVVNMTVSNVPGDGVYMRVDNIQYLADLQRSFSDVAGYVMVQETGVSPPFNAVVVDFDPNEGWEDIGGRSADLAFALALASTRGDTEYNRSVAVTGDLRRGKVEPVTDVRAKAIAAREAGYDMLLVPPGSPTDVEGIDIVEVETFDEAREIALVNSSRE